MESINFLKEELNRIYTSLPYLEIKYEYRSNINTHLIEVRPIHCYEKDNQYIKQQVALEDIFEELFPQEEILFMTDNVLIKIDNAILELGTSTVVRNVPVEFEVISCSSFNSEYIQYDSLIEQIFSNLNFEGSYIQCIAPPTVVNNEESYYLIGDVKKRSFFEKLKLKKDTQPIKKGSDTKSESFFLL